MSCKFRKATNACCSNALCLASHRFSPDSTTYRWNSTSWDEFARKWNKPVHTFLLRHVYTSTMTNYQLSRQSATFVTFLLSAAVHELVMVIVTKKFRLDWFHTIELVCFTHIHTSECTFFWCRSVFLSSLIKPGINSRSQDDPDPSDCHGTNSLHSSKQDIRKYRLLGGTIRGVPVAMCFLLCILGNDIDNTMNYVLATIL